MSTKRITIVLGLILVATIAYIGFQDAVRTWQNLQNQKNSIEQLNTEYKKLDKELDHTKESKQKSQEEVQKLEEEKKKLEEERLRLESELQAKAEAKAKLAASSSRVINAATGTQTASAISGDKSSWLAASSIPQDQWGSADWLVTKESGWNPNAINRSSGACGLAQALPCSKVGANPHDPVVSLNWMNGYVNGRYGGWPQAYAFWQKNKWY